MQPIIRAFVEDALELMDPPDPVVEFGARHLTVAEMPFAGERRS